MRIISRTCLIIALLATQASSQTSLLPAQMETVFAGSEGPFAAVMFLPASDPLDEAAGRFWFENIGPRKGVGVLWNLKHNDTLLRQTVDFFDTSFKPTAVCQRAGTGTELYVAGWSERESKAIIEHWKMTDIALGTVMGPAGAPTSMGLTYSMTRTRLLACPSTDPITSLAVHLYRDELWLLHEKSSQARSVYAIDLSNEVDCTSLQPLAINGVNVDEVSFPQIADFTTLVAQQHPSFGYVIFLEERRPWESGWDYSEPSPLLVFRDEDMNGTVDFIETPTYTDFYSANPASTWDWKY